MSNRPDLRSFLLIANPTSGRGRGRRIAEEVAAKISAAGRSASVQFTQERGHAERLAYAALTSDAPPDCIVACGGDGTIHEVANAIASARSEPNHNRPIMGLVPAGRCNDFARAFGLFPEPAFIAETLLHGHPTPIDLGRVNDRYFCTVAAVGVDADVTRFVHEMKMPLRGTSAYIYGAIRVLLRYRPRRMRLRGDFGVVDRPLFLASTANTAAYGGAIRIVPMADPADGLLHLCVIDGVSRLRAFAMLPIVLAAKHISHPEVRFLAATDFALETDEPADIWADGEPIAATPARFQIAPAAIQLLVPAESHHTKR